ncbi:MAG: hemin-degrading factor [Alphaproteobacteria bacterium]|jgi:putative hemin transport protein|nr:hemin-degrading factor [Alphaproteobacteria bacterium]
MSMQSQSQATGAGLPLAASWQALKQAEKNLRIRDAAQKLGVSEAELLATGCGSTATRLQGDWREVLKRVPALGRVMALTRNEQCVHERKGVYNDPSFQAHMGLVLGEDIDLRLFMSQWKIGFAVQEPIAEGIRRSLQFFDASGEAVHKIYLQNESDVAAYDKLVADFTAPDQSPVQSVAEKPARGVDRPDGEIEVAGLREGWATLKDTHDFFGLLRKFKVGRQQALRLGGGSFAVKLGEDVARTVLNRAAASETPIMVFVGSSGCIQIHSGRVRKIVPMGPWINVLDPDFNLHLRESGVAEAWLVRKPTTDGDVTAVELFDANGDQVAQLFGTRKPGQPENRQWRALAHGLVESLPAGWN